jgi:transposase
VVRKKLSRKQLLHFTANRQIDLIEMEACGGAHFLRQALQEYFGCCVEPVTSAERIFA